MTHPVYAYVLTYINMPMSFPEHGAYVAKFIEFNLTTSIGFHVAH